MQRIRFRNLCLKRFFPREIPSGARVAQEAAPNWASSGHLRRCSDADTTNKYLSLGKIASREIRCGARVAMAAVPNWASSGHLRRCCGNDTINKYFNMQKMLLYYHGQLLWSSDGSRPKLGLIRSTTTLQRRRYDQQREIRYGARVALAAVPNWASSGHLRRCSDAETTNKYLSFDEDASLLSWPTNMGHYKLLNAIFTA
eukprot:scaffold11070_cov164-Skeletonema_dohrnii-CCMP3373.AAC.4